MQQPAVHHVSDPQATIAITKQPEGFELQPGRKWVLLGLPVPELCDSASLGNQDSAVIAFNQGVDSLRRIWHCIEFGGARLPSPDAVHRSQPEIASDILI